MAQCKHEKADGTHCKVQAMAGSTYCWGHDPALADARRAAASKGGKAGGRGRGQPEIARLKSILSDMTAAVLDNTLAWGAAYAANALINSQLRALEMERKLKETEALEERIAALEQAIAEGRDTNKWA